MARVSSNNAGLTLFLASDDLNSHRLRWLAAEKSVEALRIVEVDPALRNDDLMVLNSRHELPTLAERNLVISGLEIVSEYLDARHPYPNLLPVDPAGHARMRMTLRILDQDLGVALNKKSANKAVSSALLSLEELLGRRKFMAGSSISMVDIFLVPMLWRLTSLGYKWPKGTEALQAYAQRLSQRPTFQQSLSRSESTMSLF